MIETIQGSGLEKLATLNTICQTHELFWSRVQESRIVMLVKTVLPWPLKVTDSASSWIVRTEVLRLMRSVMPFIQHITGDFWDPLMLTLSESLRVSDYF